MEVILCEELLAASSMPDKTRCWLALRIGMLLRQIETLERPV